MAALDFPASPTVGQQYPSPPTTGVPVYTWDGEKWTTGTATITGNFVLKAGDTMTGNLQINKAEPVFQLIKTGTSGQSNFIGGYTNSIARWTLNLGDSVAESGGNIGSDFSIGRYTDAGTGIDTPFYISRASGNITMPKAINTGPLTINGNLLVSGPSFQMGGISMLAPNGTNNTLYMRASDCYMTLDTNNAWWYIQSGTSTMIRLQYPLGEFVLAAGGHGYQNGGGSWFDASDIRIKNVQGEYKAGLEDVAKLRPIVYTYKGNDTHDPPSNTTVLNDPKAKEPATVPYQNSTHYNSAKEEKVFRGLIAQEVETIFPEMVTKRAGFIDGKPVTDLRDLDTTPLIFALVNAVKELKARVEQLEAAP